MRRLTHLIVLSAFLFSCGGHWYVLQAVAWANMIREYSQVVPLAQAVQMTLSGQYPCAMCKAIAEKKQQAAQDQWVSLDKYDKKFVPPVAVAAVAPTGTPFAYLVFSVHLQFRAEAPPTPPPRPFLNQV